MIRRKCIFGDTLLIRYRMMLLAFPPVGDFECVEILLKGSQEEVVGWTRRGKSRNRVFIDRRQVLRKATRRKVRRSRSSTSPRHLRSAASIQSCHYIANVLCHFCVLIMRHHSHLLRV